MAEELRELEEAAVQPQPELAEDVKTAEAEPMVPADAAQDGAPAAVAVPEGYISIEEADRRRQQALRDFQIATEVDIDAPAAALKEEQFDRYLQSQVDSGEITAADADIAWNAARKEKARDLKVEDLEKTLARIQSTLQGGQKRNDFMSMIHDSAVAGFAVSPNSSEEAGVIAELKALGVDPENPVVFANASPESMRAYAAAAKHIYADKSKERKNPKTPIPRTLPAGGNVPAQKGAERTLTMQEALDLTIREHGERQAKGA